MWRIFAILGMTPNETSHQEEETSNFQNASNQEALFNEILAPIVARYSDFKPISSTVSCEDTRIFCYFTTKEAKEACQKEVVSAMKANRSTMIFHDQRSGTGFQERDKRIEKDYPFGFYLRIEGGGNF